MYKLKRYLVDKFIIDEININEGDQNGQKKSK